nr:TolC family protein [Cloacibacterium sp.]
TQETYKVGLIEEQNVEQLEYSYKNLISTLANLKRTQEKLEITLKYLMGYPLDQNISLLTSFGEMLEKNKTLVAKEESMDFSNHIDIRLKNNVIKLNELKLKLQKSKALPTLAAALNSSYNGYAGDFTFLNRSQQWFNTSAVALQLDIPIFSGLQRHWQTEQAKLDLEKAKLEKDDTQKNLQNDYFAKAVDYENSYDSYKTAQELINLSSNIYRKQNIKFKEGMGTSFDLQNSETQLFQSQAKYYQAAMELIQAKIKLDKAKGVL